MRTRYVWREGLGCIDARQAPPRAPPPRSSLPCPHVLRDGLDDLWHPVTGKHFDSKAAFRKATRDAGCIEAGDDASLHTPRPMTDEGLGGVEQDIKDAYERLSAGN